MKILATFINFASEPDVVELIHAWDEYSVDSNPTGYDDTKQEALATYGAEVLNSVSVTINIDDAAIHDALNPHVEIPGSVEVDG